MTASEVGDGIGGGLCSFCLSSGDGAEGDMHGIVDGSSIEEESANHLLNLFEA